jgi:hypothetical protein
VPDNVRRGRPQGKCNRKQTADHAAPVCQQWRKPGRLRKRAGREARVKGCGKSAPRFRQRQRHGKPHREQDRIGIAGSSQASRVGETRGAGRRGFEPVSGPLSGLVARGAPQVAPQMNGHRAGATPPYRTRLTGQLAICLAGQVRTDAQSRQRNRRARDRAAARTHSGDGSPETPHS